MQIKKVAQGCHLDNQAEFVRTPINTNQQNNSIVENISGSTIEQIGASTGLYAQTAAVENKHCGCGSVHYIAIGHRRLHTVAEATGLWDAESIIFNRGNSVASWTFTARVFHHAQRPVERTPA